VQLSEECENVGLYLDMHIETVENSSDEQQIATHCASVTDYFEALAICELAVDAELDIFFHHLIRSAQTRKWLLLRSIEKKPMPRPSGLDKVGDVNPQLCAIAAAQMGLAVEIAKLSSAQWIPDLEYEDDFCYGHFLNRYLLGAEKKELEIVLDRFEKALEGQASVRLDLCRELLSPAEKTSESKLVAFIENREKMLQEIGEKSVFGTDALFYTNSTIFIEALAWLRLLENVGVNLKGEFRFCPRAARTKQYSPFVAQGFPYMNL